ncbi:MAG: AraC family transcriptional regulator [Eubacteriales bacterium]|nr:AraC family transcriptional regulator [Eubacteriales bacterium]
MHPCIENLYFEKGLHIGHVDIMRHNAWELIFITRGEVHVEIAGKSYDAAAPSMIFISNYEPHVLTVRSEVYERYVMLVNPSVAKSALRPAFLQTVFSIHSPSFCHVLPLEDGAALDDFRMLFRNLLTEREIDNAGGEGEQVWLSALLWRLYRLNPCLFSMVGGSAEKIVASIRTELENHPERKLDLNALAAANYISSYYLSHVFHRVTGYTIKRYLLLCRISLACMLLSEGSKTVAQVAVACGFTDASNFSRYFREITGMTPWEYRKIGKTT